jgi:hypothetical protein
MWAERDKVNEEKKRTGSWSPTRTKLLNTVLDEETLPEFDKPQQPKFEKDVQGRTIFLTCISDGMPWDTAAKKAGWSMASVSIWLKKGAAGESDLHYKFLNDVREAEADAEQMLVNRIKDHGADVWQANAWLLERRWAHNWGRKVSHEHDVHVQNDTVVQVKYDLAERIIEDATAREQARSALESGNARLLIAGGSSETSDE